MLDVELAGTVEKEAVDVAGDKFFDSHGINRRGYDSFPHSLDGMQPFPETWLRPNHNRTI